MGEISGYDRSSISGRIKAYPDAGEGQGSPVCSICCAHRIWRSIKRDGTYYRKADEKKDGGAYRTISGHIKRVDEESHCLILEEGERILLEDIFDLAFTAHEK